MRLALIALALTLAACGEAQPVDPAAPETPIPVEPDGGIGDGAGPPEAVAADSAIPARFHGVWDAETGTCDPASDLRLEIGAQRITFYESIGDVSGVRGAASGPATVSLAMEGEGETWDMDMTLDLVGSGADERLVTRHEDAVGEPLAHKRCPA